MELGAEKDQKITWDVGSREEKHKAGAFSEEHVEEQMEVC